MSQVEWCGRVLVSVLVAAGAAWAGSSPELILRRPAGGVPPHLSIQGGSNTVVTLETSADLATWAPFLVGHELVEDAPDLRQPTPGWSFYRAIMRPVSAGDDGKNLISYEDEPFRSGETDPWRHESRWIKFALLLGEPHRVWFQESDKYPFHYEFATARLPGFKGMSRAQFDAVTLHRAGQEAVLGAIVFPPSTNLTEVGIQFVGLEAYPREQIAGWFETVRAMIRRPPEVEVLYLPTFEQAGVARQHSDWFAARGIPVSTAGRWVVGDECYAPGWALGRLVFVPGAEIGEAYRGGRLRPEDILLTDAVPAEVPPLAGIVSLSPATPNSHVALLSKSFGIPFVHLAEAAMIAAVQRWTNQDVMVRAIDLFGGCELSVAAIDGPIDPSQRAAILALKAAPRLQLPPKKTTGRISLPAGDLTPADSGRAGGKAANFGVLRRRIPDHSPSPALAFTFDLWDAYLDQALTGGQSLRAAIAQRLQGFAWPPDMAALQRALDDVKSLILDQADFDAAQKQAILDVLQTAGFESTRNIRFRSSTNVEDSEQFSGAGLYDSYSGCLADDLDGDSRGPSACDPEESNERGVFRALRRVYASFYNGNAYLERLRHQVDEATVGMAVLVHYSTPDAFELANGVATLDVNKTSDRFLTGDLVTQLGAVSVTNPDSTAVPETVSVQFFGASPTLTVEKRSSLVPLGGAVMDWEADYRQLAGLLNEAARGYEAEFPGKTELSLDFEYKKEMPGNRLSIKQVREIPKPPQRTYVPWLLNTTNRYEVRQGEFGDLISKHRLKSAWSFRVRMVRMSDTNLVTSVLEHLDGTWREGTNTQSVSGSPTELPGYAFHRAPDQLLDQWYLGAGDRRRDFQLRLWRIPQTSTREGPLVTLGDHPLDLVVKYAAAQPTLAYLPESGEYTGTTTREESVQLAPISPVTSESLRQERRFTKGTMEVLTRFWWPAPPKGISAGYTAPVQAWIETRITGLTTRPLVMHSEWAQTYQPGHHNFFEEFAFEPRLDPEVPQDLIEELTAKNVKAVIVGAGNGGFPEPWWFIWGADDRFRKL